MSLRSMPLSPSNPLAQGPPDRSLPTLWTQLEPRRRQALAQHLGEMIRRVRLQANPPMERARGEAFDDYR